MLIQLLILAGGLALILLGANWLVDGASSIAKKAGVSKAQAGKLLNTVLGCIADNICEGDGEVAIPDFGRFYIKSCQARTGFNPNTKERIEIEAHDKIAFKASENMAIYSRKHSAE